MEILVREDDVVAHDESATDGAQERSFVSAPEAISCSGITRQGTQVQNEIICSEENFVKELRTLVNVFLGPLEMWVAEGGDEAAITSGDLSEIFSNAKDVLAFNERLLQNLVADCENHKCSGATFMAATDMYETYSLYVKNYAKALKRLESCEECPLFKTFVRACEFQEACHGLNLRAYLIQPVQRVPRYRLLLMELLKQCRKSHPHRTTLSKALKHVSRIGSKLNDDASDTLQLIRALELQDEFGESFLKPSSRLVKEGLLHKVVSGGPRPYKFALFNDTFLYGTETLMAKLSRTVDQMVSDYRKYKAHGMIPLHDCLVLDDPDSSDAFVIARRGEGKSFLALAASPEEKQEWIQAFEEAFARIANASGASEVASNLGSAASTAEDSDEELTDSPLSDGRTSTSDSAGDTNEDGITAPSLSDGRTSTSDSAGDTNEDGITATAVGGEVSSSDEPSRSKSWTPSVGALAQSVSATMSSRLPFGYGKSMSEWAASKTSSTTTPSFNDSSVATTTATSGGRISSDARPASFVQVLMLVDGQTETKEVSLPAGYDFGVFRVERPAMDAVEDETAGVSENTSLVNAWGAEDDGNGVASIMTSSVEEGSAIQSRPRSLPEDSNISASAAAGPDESRPYSIPKERKAKRSRDMGSILKMLAIIEQGTLGISMSSSWPQGKGSSAEEDTERGTDSTSKPDPEEPKPSVLADKAENTCADSIQSGASEETEWPEEGKVSSDRPFTSSNSVQIECDSQVHGPDLSSQKSDTEPGEPAADISETFARTPVTSRRSSRENSRAYCEADSVGDPADYDGQESNASGDRQDVPESEEVRQPRFLRHSKSFGDSETPPAAERSFSPVKSGLTTPAANLFSSLLGNRLQGGKSRSIPAGCRDMWEASVAMSKKITDQAPAAKEPRRRNSVSGAEHGHS